MDSVQNAVHRTQLNSAFQTLQKEKSPEWILEGDIKGCFDNISHEWILNHIPMDKMLLRKWLKCGYIETKRLFPTKNGTPQGSAISPVICNMVLDGIIDEGFDFLGVNIKKYKGKLLIYAV